jgi:hypothetical protein
VDTQAILRSAVKVAVALEKAIGLKEANEKNLSAHSVELHRQSQNMKIVRLEQNAQSEMKTKINLKSVGSQSAHFVPTDIRRQSALRNQIAQQR